MKILHLGKNGNIEKYLPSPEYLDGIEIVDLPITTTVEDILEKAKDAKYIVADAIASVPGELIRQMPNLRMIHSEGVAYNSFDICTAAETGVYVCNCKGMNAMAVAEQTLLLMLGVLRNVTAGDKAVRAGNQITMKEGYMHRGDLLELCDVKVGLVGFGDIAKCVAKLLKAFQVETFYYSRHRASKEIEEEYGVSYLPIDELCASCKMISIHVPVTPDTEGMVNEKFFSKMIPGSYLINTARGEIVDSQALVNAIQKKIIKGAGLDTVAGEPVKKDNILLKQPQEVLDRILFSPHIGGITASSFQRGYEMIWEDIFSVERGERPKRIVNG